MFSEAIIDGSFTLLVTCENVYVAEGGFDPPTSGLWAQHASSAPLCWLYGMKLLNKSHMFD